MSVEENKATLKRMYDEVWNKGNLSLASEVASPDYQYGDYTGPEGYSQIVTLQRDAFPDIQYTIDQVIGEGDWLAYVLTINGTFNGKGMWGGAKPNGKKIKLTVPFFTQFKDGKILTTTAFADMLGFYQQIGALPPNEEIAKAYNESL